MELLGLLDTVSELEDDQGVCYDHDEASDDDFETDLESDSGLCHCTIQTVLVAGQVALWCPNDITASFWRRRRLCFLA